MEWSLTNPLIPPGRLSGWNPPWELPCWIEDAQAGSTDKAAIMRKHDSTNGRGTKARTYEKFTVVSRADPFTGDPAILASQTSQLDQSDQPVRFPVLVTVPW